VLGRLRRNVLVSSGVLLRLWASPSFGFIWAGCCGAAGRWELVGVGGGVWLCRRLGALASAVGLGVWWVV